MSDPRDDLAAIIDRVFTEHSIDQYEELVTQLDVARYAADAILAAGWTPPRDNLRAPLTEIEVRRR